MMISAAPTVACQTSPSPKQASCSQKREQRGMPIEMMRIMGLDTAAKLLGKGRLADELNITVRALNYKIDAGRGVSDADVIAAARGLEERAARFHAHAQKLRAVVSPAQSDTVSPQTLALASIGASKALLS